MENFNVPHAELSTMTENTWHKSGVSRMALRKADANAAMSPKAVTRLLDITPITSATSTGNTINDTTKDREYDTPECVKT